MRRKILQSVTLPSVLANLAELSKESYEVLKDDIRSPLSFDSDIERVQPLAERIGLDTEDVQFLLGALAFIYEEIHSGGVEDNELSEVVSGLLKTITSADKKSPLTDAATYSIVELRLIDIMHRNHNLDEFKKIQRLRSGFLPNATGFASFVDIRSNLSDDGLSISSLIPLVQFRISTDSNDEAMKSFVFQLDERGIHKLKEAVEKAENKLKTIASHSVLSSLVLIR